MQVTACALLSLVVHPMTPDNILSGITMAFYCYLHFISMLPQLQAVQRREVCLILFSILMVHRHSSLYN
jgi:hypothetical protein